MKKTVSQKHYYTFYFINLTYPVAEQMFNTLGNPEAIKNIVGANASYDSIWNVVNFQEDDFKTYNYQTLETILDLDYDNPDEGYVVGFKFNEKLDKETLADIYYNLLFPILKSFDDKIELSKTVRLHSEYFEVDSEIFKF